MLGQVVMCPLFWYTCGWENSSEVDNGQAWTNWAVQAIRWLFSPQLASSSALFLSRSRWVPAVYLNVVNAGSADRGGVNR
jgi:hypothetical protein